MRSFFLLTHVDLGFNPKNVLFVVFAPPLSHNKISVTPHQKFASPQGLALLRDIAERLKALPGVAHVAIEDAMPGYSPSAGYKVSVPGVTHTEEVGLFACDENLVPTLELRMVQGRWLSEQRSTNRATRRSDQPAIGARLLWRCESDRATTPGESLQGCV